MSRNNPFDRGQSKTQVAATQVGRVSAFPDVNWGSTERVKPFLTNHMVYCMVVKNNSGGALLPGYVVTFESGYWGSQVDAVAGAGAVGHGIVDEYLPAAGVPDGSYFYIVRRGPTECVQSTGVAQTQGALTKTAAAGKCVADAADPCVIGCFGSIITTSAATADIDVRVYCNFEGK